MNYLARVAAIVFHPLFLILYCTLLVLFLTDFGTFAPFAYKAKALLFVAIDACLLPLLIIGMFIHYGRVVDIEMRTREERPAPLLVCGLLVSIEAYFVLRRLVPLPLASMLTGMGILLFVAGVISVWWKISLHTLGAGALLAFVVSLGILLHTEFSLWAAAAFVIGGVSGWSRLVSASHSPSQLLVGYLLGFFIMFVSMFVMI